MAKGKDKVTETKHVGKPEQPKLPGMPPPTELEKAADSYILQFERLEDQKKREQEARKPLMAAMKTAGKKTLQMKDNSGAAVKIVMTESHTETLTLKRV